MNDESYMDDPIIKVFGELNKVKDNPRLVVLLSHGFLELLINTLIDEKCKNSKKIVSNHRDYPHSAKLLILNEMGIISDDIYRKFDWFRKIRNRAAHEPFFEITNSDLSIFKEKETNDPQNLYWLFNDLVSNFWNEHIELLGPVFAPTIVGAKKAHKGKTPPNNSFNRTRR